MYAVTAATGQFGRLVVEALKQRVDASQIVAIVRDPSKAADLGVEIRQADYTDPAGLEAALKGVEKLLLISASDFERLPKHRNVVNAAKASGVKFLAYTSLLNADRWTLPPFDQHSPTEALIRSSGIPYTFLRNGWYTENNTSNLGPALAYGSIMGAAGDGRIAWASRRDLAEAAAAVLASDGHEGRTYELGGDSALTMNDLAAEVARQSGKAVTYVNAPKADYAAFLVKVGLPAPVADMVAAVDADAVPAGLLDTDSNDLSNLIGRPTTPISDTIAAALEAEQASGSAT